jgi:predicted nucleic acid-binding protein
LFLTSITVAELLAGVAALPAGRRRNKLAQALTEQVLPLFEGRVLAFDARAAHDFGRVQAGAQASGNPIGFADAAIAAIASAHRFALATRNVRDFKGTGVQIIDPWSAR